MSELPTVRLLCALLPIVIILIRDRIPREQADLLLLRRSVVERDVEPAVNDLKTTCSSGVSFEVPV